MQLNLFFKFILSLQAGADDSTQSSELEAVTSTSCEETTSASSSVNENVRFVDGDFQLPFDHEMHFKCCTFINKKIATLKEVISFYTKSEQV